MAFTSEEATLAIQAIQEETAQLEKNSADNNDMLTQILESIEDSGGQGGDIAAHNADPAAHPLAIAQHNADAAAHAALFESQAALFNTKIRRRLSANATLFVRPDGNDSNDGLANTAAGALKTLAGLMAWLLKTDLAGYTVLAQFAPGNYAGGIIRGFFFDTGHLMLKSADPSDWATFTSTVSFSGVYSSSAIITDFNMEEMLVFQYSICAVGNINFTGSDLLVKLAVQECSIVVPAPATKTTINFSNSSAIALRAELSGCFLGFGRDITFNFDNYTASQEVFKCSFHSYINIGGVKFSGSATGMRYLVAQLSAIWSYGQGINAIPGTVAGVVNTNTGGIYV